MSEKCFCLRWNNYQSSVIGDLKFLLEKEEFVDVTLACDGRKIKAHRLMLSACSNYFRKLFQDSPNEHPIIVLKDVQFWELEAIMDFIYNGQVNVLQDQLPGFIRTAETLQIKGLAAVAGTCPPPKRTELPKSIPEVQLRHLNSGKEVPGWTPNQGVPTSILAPTSVPSDEFANRQVPPLINPHKRFRIDTSPMVYTGNSYADNRHTSPAPIPSIQQIESPPSPPSPRPLTICKEEECTPEETDPLQIPDEHIRIDPINMEQLSQFPQHSQTQKANAQSTKQEITTKPAPLSRRRKSGQDLFSADAKKAKGMDVILSMRKAISNDRKRTTPHPEVAYSPQEKMVDTRDRHDDWSTGAEGGSTSQEPGALTNNVLNWLLPPHFMKDFMKPAIAHSPSKAQEWRRGRRASLPNIGRRKAAPTNDRRHSHKAE